jgi:hypothetical protein
VVIVKGSSNHQVRGGPLSRPKILVEMERHAEPCVYEMEAMTFRGDFFYYHSSICEESECSQIQRHGKENETILYNHYVDDYLDSTSNEEDTMRRSKADSCARTGADFRYAVGE